MRWSENPLQALLEMRSRRQPTMPLWKAMLASAAASLLVVESLGLVAEFLSSGHLHLTRVAPGALWGAYVLNLLVCTFLIVVMLPARRVAQDASILGTLRAGRGLVELLGSGVSGGEILDGVARHTVCSVLREGAPYILPLLLGWVLLPHGEPRLFAALALLWAPATALLIGGTSYLAQAWELWTRDHERSVVSQLLGVGLFMLLCPLSACVIIGVLGGLSRASSDVVSGGVWLLGWMAFYLALNRVVSRPLALLGLERLPRLRERLEQTGARLLRRHRNAWIRPFSQNPIVVRETCRTAQRTPGGLLGLVVLRLPALWLAPLTGAFLYHEGATEAQIVCGLAPLVLLVQVIIASLTTLPALVDEVEHSTLEVLQQSRLTAAEFCDGWARVGYGPRLLEWLLLAPATLGLAWTGNLPMWLPVLWLPLGAAALLFASWAGLWSSLARKRRVAHERLCGLATVTMMIATAVGLYTAPTTSWPGVMLTLTGLLGVLSYGARHSALSQIR